MFIDEERAKGRAVESISRVLREQGVQVAARTYRAWKRAQPSNRDLADALIIHALLATAGTPEGMYGRRRMTAHLRGQGHDASPRRVDRLMRDLGPNGGSAGATAKTTPLRMACGDGTAPGVRPATV